MDSELIPRGFATELASKGNKKKFLALDSPCGLCRREDQYLFSFNMYLIY